MKQDLEDKAVELLDKAENGIDKLTDALTQIGEKYGPDVVDAGLEVARIAAAQNLVNGILTVFAFFGLIVVMIKIWPGQGEWGEDGPSLKAGKAIACGVAVLFSGVFVLKVGFPNLFYLWNWVGLIEPKLWIAHKILGW